MTIPEVRESFKEFCESRKWIVPELERSAIFDFVARAVLDEIEVKLREKMDENVTIRPTTPTDMLTIISDMRGEKDPSLNELAGIIRKIEEIPPNTH